MTVGRNRASTRNPPVHHCGQRGRALVASPYVSAGSIVFCRKRHDDAIPNCAYTRDAARGLGSGEFLSVGCNSAAKVNCAILNGDFDALYGSIVDGFVDFKFQFFGGFGGSLVGSAVLARGPCLIRSCSPVFLGALLRLGGRSLRFAGLWCFGNSGRLLMRLLRPWLA
jgi:hypothetical protein